MPAPCLPFFGVIVLQFVTRAPERAGGIERTVPPWSARLFGEPGLAGGSGRLHRQPGWRGKPHHLDQHPCKLPFDPQNLAL